MSVGREKASDHDFRVLGLSRTASRTEVKRAYRELVRRWHPDHFQQEPVAEQRQAEEKLKEITGAYRRISQEWAKQGSRSSKQRSEQTSPHAASVHQSQADSHSAACSDHSAWGSLFGKGRGITLSPVLRQRTIYFSLAFLCLTALVVINLVFFREPPAPTLPGVNLGGGLGQQVNSGSSRPRLSSVALPHPTPRGPQGLPVRGPVWPQSPSSKATPKTYFSLGSSKADVLRIQGIPDKIRSQTWIYNLSEVHFKDNRVDRYNNFDGFLKVRLLPLHPAAKIPAYLGLGSTKEEVLAVQGTPTRIFHDTWYYGFSSIHFKGGRVAAFDNFFGNLRIRMLPSLVEKSAMGTKFFTIGSTPDEVLAAQGTPTRIQGNMWFYHFSNILFRNGKVEYVFDSSGNLHFVPPHG